MPTASSGASVRGPAEAAREEELTPFIAALRQDLRVQARGNIHAAVAVSTAVVIGLLLLLPDAAPDMLRAFIVFSDPAMLGITFVGALVLMEKAEGTLSALAATPLRIAAYLWAKTLTLGAAATASGIVVAFVALGPDLRWELLAPGLALTSAVMTLLGFAAVARIETLNQYALAVATLSAVAALPMLAFFGALPTWAVAPIPTWASLTLVIGAVAEPPPSPALAWGSVLYLGLWIALGYALARRALARQVMAADGASVRLPRAVRSEGRSVRRGLAGALGLDLRSIRRDRMLLLLLLMPPLMFLLLRLLPSATVRWPALAGLLDFIAAGALLNVGVCVAFALGMLLVDEKDEGVAVALTVTPVHPARLLLGRAGMAAVYGAALGALGLVLLPPAAVAPPRLLALAALLGLLGPGVGLAMAALARNKLEALALFKVLNATLLLPLVAFFLPDGPWRLLILVVPAGWWVEAFRVATLDTPLFWGLTAGGTVFAVAVLAGTTRRFARTAYGLGAGRG